MILLTLGTFIIRISNQCKCRCEIWPEQLFDTSTPFFSYHRIERVLCAACWQLDPIAVEMKTTLLTLLFRAHLLLFKSTSYSFIFYSLGYFLINHFHHFLVQNENENRVHDDNGVKLKMRNTDNVYNVKAGSYRISQLFCLDMMALVLASNSSICMHWIISEYYYIIPLQCWNN